MSGVPILLDPVKIKNRDPLFMGKYIFNQLTFDTKSRWYSKKLHRGYFVSVLEWEGYLAEIKPNKPIDLSTIRVCIYEYFTTVCLKIDVNIEFRFWNLN